ncbi:MAG: N-acetylneuraminate synthase family protein [Actinobacteria bacterium]|nr:N-acetylneuraminate synthase family protein [Actinomycetota bacterium]
MTTVRLGKKTVGQGHPCYVIAEAGSNHNRDLDTSKRLIDEAADAGADAIKFQTYSGRTLYSTKAPQFDYLSGISSKKPHELLEDISLPREWQSLLADHSRQAGIEFLSSPFDLQAVDELDALGVAVFKIASFEIVDLPFIEYVGSKARPVILSTGMATLAEIEEAMDAARQGGATEICLLQCASLYPAPASIMNLAAMDTLKTAFKVPVGLSDHSLGTHIPVAAAARGAHIIEKHFTLDRSHPGPDHPFAIEPHQLKELVQQIHDVEAAIGDGLKSGPTTEEAKEMYTKARRSVVAAATIAAGTPITRTMLTVKRPGFGIKPRFIDAIVGRRAKRDIEEDEVITWEMV